MDDIAEQQQLAGEISTAISNPVGFDQDVDEVYWELDCAELINIRFAKMTFFCSKDDLLRELEELQNEDLDSELLNLPTAPNHNLPQAAGRASKNPVLSNI